MHPTQRIVTLSKILPPDEFKKLIPHLVDDDDDDVKEEEKKDDDDLNINHIQQLYIQVLVVITWVVRSSKKSLFAKVRMGKTRVTQAAGKNNNFFW